MKIHVELDRCEGHGICVDQAASLFSFDDDGNLIDRLDGAEVPSDLVASANAAVAGCPVAALRVSS